MGKRTARPAPKAMAEVPALAAAFARRGRSHAREPQAFLIVLEGIFREARARRDGARARGREGGEGGRRIALSD